VIAGHHDDRIIQLAGFLERRNAVCDKLVESLHFKIVIRHIAAHFGRVREMGEQFDL